MFAINIFKSNFREFILTQIEQIRHFTRENLLKTISATIVFSSILIILSCFNLYNIYSEFQSNIPRSFEIVRITGNLVAYDKLFTSYTWLTALSENFDWEKSYRLLVDPATADQKRLLSILPDSLAITGKKSDTSANALFNAETQAFKAIHSGKSEQAFNILNSRNYLENKIIFEDNAKALIANSNQIVDIKLAKYRSIVIFSLIFSAITLPILILAWRFVWSTTRSRLKEIKDKNAQLIDLQSVRVLENQAAQNHAKELENLENDYFQDVKKIINILQRGVQGDLSFRIDPGQDRNSIIIHSINELTNRFDSTLSALSNYVKQLKTSCKLHATSVDIFRIDNQAQTKAIELLLPIINNFNHSAKEIEQLSCNNPSIASLTSNIKTGEIVINSVGQKTLALQDLNHSITEQINVLMQRIEETDRLLLDSTDEAKNTELLALKASLVRNRSGNATSNSEILDLESIVNQFVKFSTQNNGLINSLTEQNTIIRNLILQIESDAQQHVEPIESLARYVQICGEMFADIQNLTTELKKQSQSISGIGQKLPELIDFNSIKSLVTRGQKVEDGFNNVQVSFNDDVMAVINKIYLEIKTYKISPTHSNNSNST